MARRAPIQYNTIREHAYSWRVLSANLFRHCQHAFHSGGGAVAVLAAFDMLQDFRDELPVMDGS